MIIVKKGTQKNVNLFRSTLHWEGTELEDIYKSASVFKRRAMKACKEEFANDPAGSDFHWIIICYNIDTIRKGIYI